VRPQDAKAHRLRTVLRLTSLIDEARRNGRLRPIEELVVRHDCHKRTIRRDVEAMRTVGIFIGWGPDEDETPAGDGQDVFERAMCAKYPVETR
jgi:hypothetical protein